VDQVAFYFPISLAQRDFKIDDAVFLDQGQRGSGAQQIGNILDGLRQAHGLGGKLFMAAWCKELV
jgi:hypothetical protein